MGTRWVQGGRPRFEGRRRYEQHGDADVELEWIAWRVGDSHKEDVGRPEERLLVRMRLEDVRFDGLEPGLRVAHLRTLASCEVPEASEDVRHVEEEHDDAHERGHVQVDCRHTRGRRTAD